MPTLLRQISNELRSLRLDLKTPRPPIVIPPRIARDRDVRIALTQWKHHHERFAICQKRIFWHTTRLDASAIEKKRRKEKWEKIAEILEIEHRMLRLLAKKTHHPDLWTSRKEGAVDSRRRTLIFRYLETTYHAKTAGPSADGSLSQKENRAKFQRFRAKRVKEIRALEREWMVALYTTVFPGKYVPPPLPLHPTELRPRKVRTAHRRLLKEFTT